ncbi:MAG: TolC family protein [Acidobacteriaceae bacterium]|nr:TolC family protein [Acidobacteriaceae bacterium]
MKRCALLLVFAAKCLFAADPPPLTLQQALQQFRTNSPALAAARAHYEAVQAGEVTARLRPNPFFSSANEDFRVFDLSRLDVANAQEFTDSLNWTIERGGKRAARIASARLGTTVAGHQLNDVQRLLEFQVKIAFMTMLQAKAVLNLAQDNFGDYQRTVNANQLRLQAGDISQTDFDRIKLQEASFQSDLLNARMALAQSRAQLAAFLGLTSPMLDVSGTITPPPLHLDLADLQQRAIANRPDYLAALSGVNKAEADYRLAIAGGATDLNLAPEYKRNGPDNTMGLTVQFPVKIFDRNQGEKLRTSRELTAARFSENAVRLQALADVAQAFETYRAADAIARLYSGDYLQRARDVRDRMEFSYQHGATNLLDFLDAIRSYRQTELAGIQAQVQVWLAIHQLSAATATELAP